MIPNEGPMRCELRLRAMLQRNDTNKPDYLTVADREAIAYALGPVMRQSIATELLEACQFVKDWLNRLEDGTEPDDPLRNLREIFHAPVHAKLDAAITKAEGRANSQCAETQVRRETQEGQS
jgi:hypothetical protein